MVERNFNTIEEQVKALHSDIELFRCDYDQYGIKRVVIRFPSDKFNFLKQSLSDQGWRFEKEEYINIQRDRQREIKGWIPNNAGTRYIRMIYVL